MPKTTKPKGLSQLTPYAIQSHERCIREGEHLADYWLARGYKVRVSIDPVHQLVDGRPTAAIVGFAVTSDMVGGLPRDFGRELPPPRPKVRRLDSANAGGLFHY